MARRHTRTGAERPPRRRRAVFSLAALAVLGAAAWFAPTVAVLTPLRDRPLQAALVGIAGSVSSGQARWGWLGGIEYRDVVLRDAGGRPAVIVPRLVIDRGLVGLAVDAGDLGTVRLVAPEAVVEVRRGGSSLEDILAPWLARSTGGGPRLELEILDGTLEIVDPGHRTTWRLCEVSGAGTVTRSGALAGWTCGGRVMHGGGGTDAVPPTPDLAAPNEPLDRTTIPARVGAALARDGGWSVAVPTGEARSITVAAQRLPLGASSVLATRFAWSWLLDGLADVRLDVSLGPDDTRIAGTVEVEKPVLLDSATLAETLAAERIEVPLDVTIGAEAVDVAKLVVTSPAVRAEAAGRLRLPEADAAGWFDALVQDDFTIAADVDLAALAAAVPGGLAVRPDVRVRGGRLDVAAAARADGGDRLLEIRAAARDLEAVQQSASADAAGERTLRWPEPFAGWVRARRGPGRTATLAIEEARLDAAAIEAAATGSAGELSLQWKADLAKLHAAAAGLFDLGDSQAAGTALGRVEIRRGDRGASLVKATVDLADVDVSAPGRPAWRDEAVAIVAEGTGRLAAGAALVDAAHVTVTAASDSFEATLSGGVVVDAQAIVAGRLPSVGPAPGSSAVAADCTLAGELARWQARLAWCTGAAVAAAEVTGRVKASAAVTAAGDGWRVTRAGGEIEKFTLAVAGRRISEPRVVVTAAGLVQPATGAIDVSAAELLSSSMSLRTAGCSWRPGTATATATLRGKAQWQADVGRVSRWLLAADAGERWQAGGRAWGTVEVFDAPGGLAVACEATGNDLTLARAPDGGRGAAPRPVWSDPRAGVALEVAWSGAGTLRIERLAVESSTFSCSARGGVGDATTRRLLELDGTVAYDWEQVSRLVSPWTGGHVRLVGSGGRPFAVRGPLGAAAPRPAPAAAAEGGGVASLPLPEDWLSATRPGGGEPAARIAVPATTRPREPAADLLRAVSLDTSLAWQGGALAGFTLGPGELPVRLFDGQLAIGPLDVAVSGGRLRGAPWVSLAADPRELVVPPGRIVDRVTIGDGQTRRLVSWLSPMLGHATTARGVMSVDVAGARLPLADPFAGACSGQVTFDAFEVTPDAALAPLVNLIVRLQAVVDPRVAFGDRAVLLRVRPDPVRVRLADRRLWHEGLVMDAGQMTVKSGGSVGADGSLAMLVEVALRGDVAGQTPVVARLLRTPLVIPLKGTVERPQFDARAIDTMLARIVENTAQAVIGEGISRGLDALLGGQQPAAPAPAPLVLPQAP